MNCYDSPIFGPVHSRRLGVSLGINLLPGDGKCCTFDCIYCECGYNADHRPHGKMPGCSEVLEALEQRLKQMQQEGPRPDVLTFAGNGEPTMHPQFGQIVDGVLALRNRYFPDAKVSLLSNSTMLHRQDVCDAVVRLDNPIMKLDTVDAEYIRQVDRPQGHYDVKKVVEQLASLKGSVIIQTMFMCGTHEGVDVDNTKEAYVGPWLESLRTIKPREVMLYTIDRQTPSPLLRKASPEQLDAIAERVRQMGIPCQVSY